MEINGVICPAVVFTIEKSGILSVGWRSIDYHV